MSEGAKKRKYGNDVTSMVDEYASTQTSQESSKSTNK